MVPVSTESLPAICKREIYVLSRFGGTKSHLLMGHKTNHARSLDDNLQPQILTPSLRYLSTTVPRIYSSTLLACPCGSIIRGHLLALKTMIPLSTLKPSVGSPSMFHRRTRTGSPRVPRDESGDDIVDWRTHTRGKLRTVFCVPFTGPSFVSFSSRFQGCPVSSIVLLRTHSLSSLHLTPLKA